MPIDRLRFVNTGDLEERGSRIKFGEDEIFSTALEVYRFTAVLGAIRENSSLSSCSKERTATNYRAHFLHEIGLLKNHSPRTPPTGAISARRAVRLRCLLCSYFLSPSTRSFTGSTHVAARRECTYHVVRRDFYYGFGEKSTFAIYYIRSSAMPRARRKRTKPLHPERYIILGR